VRPSPSPVQSLVRSLGELLESAVSSARLSRQAKELAEEIRKHLAWIESLLHVAYTIKHPSGAFVISESELRIGLKTSAELVSEWTEIVRSICDSITTRVPYHMGEWLSEELELLHPGATPPAELRRRIALCPTTDLNYYHQNAAVIRKDLQNLQDQHVTLFSKVLQQATPFPQPTIRDDLPTMIRFHYSLPNDLLLNPILFHELGHHIWQTVDPLKSVRVEIGNALLARMNTWSWFQKTFAAEVAAKKWTDKAHAVLRTYSRTLFSWLQELFCDAFATTVLGPQFALASDSLFRFLKSNPWEFNVTHPADIYRARRIWKLLSLTGWSSPGSGDSFSLLATEVINTCRPTSGVVSSATDPWEDVLTTILRTDPDLKDAPDNMLFTLVEMYADKVDEAALQIVPNAKDRAKEFWDVGSMVAELLNNAIVPSTVVVPSTAPATTTALNPLPSTVTNVARVLIEVGCPELLANWKASGHEHEFQRVRVVEQRLSEWTIKGVADSNLIARWSRAQQTPNP
jgi:hypothetical protein